MKTMKTITTKAELRLADEVEFAGKYVSSLMIKAQSRGFVGSTVAEILKSVDAKRKSDAKRIWGINSLAEYDRLVAKAKEILYSLPGSGYSRGSFYSLVLAGTSQAIAFRDNRIKGLYGGYTPSHGSHTLVVTLQQLRDLQSIEGVWTIAGKDGKASWITTNGLRQHYEIEIENGFLVGKSHGKSIAECEELEATKIAKRLSEIKNDNRFIGFRHGKLLGACEAGIAAFANRNGLNLEYGYRLGFLKSLGDTIASSYLRRA